MAGYLFFTLSICRDETKEKKRNDSIAFLLFLPSFFYIEYKIEEE